MEPLFSTEKVEKLLPAIKQFLEEKVYPNEIDWLNKDLKESFKAIDQLREEVKARGLWAPHLAEHEGGLGLNLVEFAQVSELLGTSPVGHYLFNCQAPDIGNMELLHQFASEELKAKYLKPLMNGEIRSCFSMTEPEFAGSNPVFMATTAVKDGDDYIINGHKWFTSSADGAAFAVVMAVTDSEHSNPYQRASMIIVSTDNPGFELVRNIPIMGEAGYGYISHAEVKYTNCRVPQSNLVGKEGQGFALAQERLGPGRIHHCMRWIGICERAFDLMCRRAASRLLDADVYLGDKQFVQGWIADSRAEINASRLMVLHTAWKMDKLGAKAVREEISTIKFYVANVLHQVLDRAIQAHGALGITEDTLLSFWYRHERGARIYDGPDEVHKSVLARRILKDYGLDLRR
ncbi:acyl-CoA dehydrogenase family protein [Peijinzhouia sedimentorum]